MTPPDPAVVLDLIEAFRRSKTMFAAVSLGVFDALAAGPKSLAELADKLKANADALERLLDACVGLQLLLRTGNGYENTPAATAYLTTSSPLRLTGYINYSNDITWKLWANLEYAVREGTHRWQQTFGWDGPIFSHFFKTEEAKREFLIGMHGLGLLSSPHVVSAFDLSGFRRLVDLGGAIGSYSVSANPVDAIHLLCMTGIRPPPYRGFAAPPAAPSRPAANRCSSRTMLGTFAGNTAGLLRLLGLLVAMMCLRDGASR